MRRKLEEGAAAGGRRIRRYRPADHRRIDGAPSNGFTVYGAHVPARLGVDRLLRWHSYHDDKPDLPSLSR